MKPTNTPLDPDVISGCSVLGIFVTGGASLFFALLAVFNEYDYVGAGLLLLAAAVAFGLLANALFRA